MLGGELMGIFGIYHLLLLGVILAGRK